MTSDTVQASNTTFGQQNLSPSYTSGAFSQNDGSASRISTSGGEHIVGISNSSLRSSIQLAETLTENYTEQANQAHQLSENQLIVATEAQAEHNRSLIDLSQHQAQQTSHGETYSRGTTASASQSFQTLDGLVDRFAKEHSISKESASQLLANASATVETGVGFSLFGLVGASAKASASVSGTTSSGSSDRSLVSAAQDYSKQSQFQNALSQATQAAHDLRDSEVSDTGRRYVQSLNAASEKSRALREESSANFQKSESFSKMASWTQANAGSINANKNQDYVNWLTQQAGPHAKTPMGIAGAQHILSHRPDLDRAYQQRFLSEMMGDMRRPEALKLPRSETAIRQSATHAQTQITLPVRGAALQALETQAGSQGFGGKFQINSQTKNTVQKEISALQDHLEAHRDETQREAHTREAAAGKTP